MDNRSTATLTAAATQATAIANANKSYADVLSAANRDNTVAGENAKVGLVNLEQTANVVQAGNLATAEANFQISTANAQASFASAVASSSGNPAAVYAATYAQAKANWIADVAPAFVTHATAVATADGQAQYDIALARGTRNLTKANADKTFADVQSTQVKTRALGEIAPTNTQLSGMLGLQNARRLSAANHTKTYEHDFAVAEKVLGIDNAEASKQREIDRANKVEAETYEDTYKAAVGDGKLTFETTIADAKLTWQQGEVTDQQTFTNSSIPINHAFSTAIIGLDQTYAVALANAEETRQFAHATAEGTFFVSQTTANNTKRTSTANAVIGLWNAQETARVGAHTDIDDVLQIPWSQYLVDAATARAAWWNGASAQYANLATDRNTAETTYTGRLATAHVTRQQAIATATKNKSLVEANTQAAEATAKANAVRDYFTAMVTPTKTYVDAIAQAERQKSVATAQAHRDYIDHESSSQRTADLNAASNAFTSTKNTQDSTYRSALAGEQADQYLDFATAEFNRTVALIAAEVSLVTTRNNAEKTYRNEESDAYLQSATSWANIDAFYRQYEANSFASAASTLASSTGTPWAAYDADFYSAQAANVTTVSNAAKTNAIAQATAQKTAEVAQTNAETTWRNAYATGSSVLNTGIAGAHLGFATAQSLIYSAMGGSNLQLPTVSRPTDLAGEYTVPGPGNTYRTSISSVTSTNYYYGWWGGYWWGAWGYYGSGYWYSGYGSYYGYLYGSQVSSAASVSLQEPAKQFPGSFWQIDSDQIADQMRDGAIEVRYGDAKVSELVTPVDVAGGLTAAMSANVAVSDGMASSNAEVMAILQGLSDTAGELWTLVGSTTQTVLSSRPATLLAEYASELVNAELQNSASSSSESSLTSDKGTASSSTSVTLTRGEQSLNAAVSAIQKTALIVKPADLTAMQKLNAYLQGVNNQKGPSIFDQASQISVNLVMGYINGQNGSLTEYGTGFAKGFFIDGAWGKVEGIGTVLKFGWGAVKQSWYNQARFMTLGNEWILESSYFNFNDQRKVEENVVKAGQMIFKVLNAVGTELGEEAFAHYHALANGSAADLQELGGKHQQVAAAVMSIGVLLSEKLRDMTPETRGRISGAITWEIAQTAAEIIFTAGTATVATKGAKFARIADKLADFAKTYDKLGDIAQPVLNRLRQISEPGGELRKLLEKFDEKAVVVERAVKVVNETLQNACFTPNTLVMTDDGQKPLGEVRAGQQVMAFDFTHGQWMFRTVKANLRNRYSGELVTISIGNDKIEATAEHPFWVVSGKQLEGRPIPKPLSTGEDEGEKLPGRWVNASDLDEGDVLQSSKGSHVSIAAIATRSVENLEVCNLSVGENHCYAVGSESVLVHNATWCSVLTEMHPGWDKIRTNLTKKFDVVLDRIHGHHIVQKTIPKEAAEKVLVNSRWKNVGNLTEAEFTIAKSSLTPDQQSAWYISESHKLMKKADVEIYEPTSAVTEKVKKELLKEHLENPKPGKSGANLTLALNDDKNVHNLATHEAVYKRLKAVEGDQARTERVLREIGEIFREGKVPRSNAQGWDYTFIDGKPVK